MTEHEDGDDVRRDFEHAMGHELGVNFHRLWNDFAILNWKWAEYLELYATRQDRVDLLNRTAGAFFRMVQDALLESITLHITRMTDPEAHGKHDNLTLSRLCTFLQPPLFEEVKHLSDQAKEQSRLVRLWRDRHFAHRDLGAALGDPEERLSPLDKHTIEAAIGSIELVLRTVERHFCGHETAWGSQIHPPGGTIDLLHAMRRADEQRAQQMRRMQEGRPIPEDLLPPPSV